MAEERCYVYEITCKTTGKSYIGISKNSKSRFNAHKSASRMTGRDRSVSKLGHAIQKYGEDDFEMKVLLCGTREYCAFMEIRLIANWKTIEEGYNIRSGGEMTVIPEKCGYPRFERYDEFLEIVRSGIHPKDIEWLPISLDRSYEILREEGISLPKYKRVKPEHATRLVEEMKKYRTLQDFDWWPYSRGQAFKVLREAGVNRNSPRAYKNKEISDDIFLNILRDFENKIPYEEMMLKYKMTRQQLYTASAKGKKIWIKKINAKYYILGMILKS